MNSKTPTSPQRKPKLTKKQRGFIKDYLETGNGTQAALANYDTTDPKTASVIASENLEKPSIAGVIADALKDEDLAEKHKQLLGAITLERLDFDIGDSDQDIQDVVDQMPGYHLLKIIRKYDKDGMTDRVFAYVRAPDNMTQDKALDKAYKIKGTYAPEKHLTGHFTIKNEDREKATRALKGAIR